MKTYSTHRLPRLTGISAIACLHLFALTVLAHPPGSVVGWGDTSSQSLPAPTGLTNVTSVRTAGLSLAVRADGTLAAWGDNVWGLANLPPGLSNVIAVAIGSQFCLALLDDGTVRQWNYWQYVTQIPPGLSNVTAIAAGSDFGVALKFDGTVVGWGSTSVPPGLSNITAVAASYNHAMALKSNCTVVCWGANDVGQSTPPPDLTNVIAISAGYYHNLALKSDGTVMGWGSNLHGGCIPPPGLSGVTQIAAGGYYSLALKTDGTLVGWGDNYYNTLSIPPGLTNILSICAGSVSLAIVQVDDAHPPSLNVASGYVNEGDQSNDVSITATLIVPSPKPASVNFATADNTAFAGRDYISKSGTLLFPPNTTTQAITVTILGNLLQQTNRSFFINLFNPTNATLVTTQSTQTIFDPDKFTAPIGFSVSPFATNLPWPTSMEFSPDGRLFVCDQHGNLRVIKNGVLLTDPFLQVVTSDCDGGECGLLGVTFDPGFATNQFVYIYYTAFTPYIHNRVTRFVANGDVAVPGSEQPILELDQINDPSAHNGGGIHFGPDGKLYVGVGDNRFGNNSQTMINRLGKILRINPDGTIPSDNPFYLSAFGANRAIWALGLRNPFSFAIQPGTGRMLINDVGENTWEEIDEGQRGANYGWPIFEGPSTNAAYRPPLLYYGHNPECAIVGAAFYNPAHQAFPSDYIGNYFYADLCGGWIRRLTPAGASLPFAAGLPGPIDLRVGPDGALYCLTLSSLTANKIYRFEYDRSSRFISAQLLPDGRLKLRVAGSLDHTFVLQGSTNLVNWQSIITNTFSTRELDIYEIPSGARRYYRLAE
jgi:glucose/arabinose dehydrogenase